MGGLGNQMFQIAHALCQSWKYNTTSIFRLMMNENAHPNSKPIDFINNIYRNINFIENINNLTRVEETDWNYNELFFNPNIHTEFYGYFQSSKNFLGYDNKIKDIFSPTKEFIDKINNIYPEVNNNSISIHLRLGNYRNISDILPIIDKSYIDYCLKDIGEYDNVFIFSNEKDWVINNLNYPNMIIVDGLTNYEEMWLMSLCKHNIISNSTFSWWGSFLNKNNLKKIYAPSIWFGPKGPSNYESIYESYWKVIDVGYNNGTLIKK